MSQPNAEEFVTLARVMKTQGRHGEVAAELFTDFPERFAERRKLYAWHERSGIRELELEDFWPHKGGMVFKFLGIDSIEDAEKLIGSEIRIPRAERAALEQGTLYVSELTGCTVVEVSSETPIEIGRIEGVTFGAGEAPLLVIRQDKREHLVPFVESFVVKLDTAARRIEMKLPEGLLELDKPAPKE